MLLTDAEGRMIIANATAEALFAAAERESEGRRAGHRPQQHVVLGRAGRTRDGRRRAHRRELTLVDPVDGSDLLFELLSTVVDDPRRAPASSRCSGT